MDRDESLREQLRDLLTWGEAHVDFAGAIDELRPEHQGASHPSIPHTPWRLVEHLRIAQHDILRFCIDPGHASPDWPDGYWPEGDAPPGPEDWHQSVESFLADRRTMVDLILDPSTDLFARIPHGDGQTILREALLLADHNAYHVGQLVTIRRLLGDW